MNKFLKYEKSEPYTSSDTNSSSPNNNYTPLKNKEIHKSNDSKKKSFTLKLPSNEVPLWRPEKIKNKDEKMNNGKRKKEETGIDKRKTRKRAKAKEWMKTKNGNKLTQKRRMKEK